MMKSEFKVVREGRAAEINLELVPVSHDIETVCFWKDYNDKKIEYGITIYGESKEANQYDYDTFTEKEFITFIKKCAELVKHKIEIKEIDESNK